MRQDLQIGHGPRRSSALMQPLDGRDERLERERLGQVAGDVELGQPLRADGRGAGDDDRRRAGRGQRRAAEQVPARVAGQVQVEQHEAGPEARGQRMPSQPRPTRPRRPRSPGPQVAREDPPQALVVLDEEDRRPRLSHRSTRSTVRSTPASSAVQSGTIRAPAAAAIRRAGLQELLAEAEPARTTRGAPPAATSAMASPTSRAPARACASVASLEVPVRVSHAPTARPGIQEATAPPGVRAPKEPLSVAPAPRARRTR